MESSSLRNPDLISLVVLTSPTLDLGSNSTCHLFRQSDSIAFRTVDPSVAFRGTPMAGVAEAIAGSAHRVVHLSDALRLALVYQLGGWYSDLDVVHLRPLSQLPHNSVSGDHRVRSEVFAGDYDGAVGNKLNNAIFHFERGHPYLGVCIKVTRYCCSISYCC